MVSKPVLSEDQLYELNWKIKKIQIGMMLSIVYYDINQYVYKEVVVTNIDFEYKKSITIVDKTILISNILTIDY